MRREKCQARLENIVNITSASIGLHGRVGLKGLLLRQVCSQLES